MLASLKKSEGRTKRNGAASSDVGPSTSNTVQQPAHWPPAQPPKKIRFSARVRPLEELLLDESLTDEHLLRTLTRPSTADDYGGADVLVQQLLSIAVGTSHTSHQRPAAEVALRALRLVASSHSPIYHSSLIQKIFERCLSQATASSAAESTSSFCVKLLAVCAECAKRDVGLQQQLITCLVDILAKGEGDFLLITECLRILSRQFAQECASRHFLRLSNICIDILMVGDVRVRLAALDLLNATIQLANRSTVELIPVEALYKSVIMGLDDNYEDIRLAALQAIALLAQIKPKLFLEDDGPSTSKASSSGNTLANMVFSRLCHACASDRQIRVRALAASLMSRIPGVSENFIEQALDKKTIASMRVDSNEPSSNSRRAFGVCVGDYEVDAVSLISQSACGALVHALEDEFYEVRESGIESLSRMITPNRFAFARQAQDFLIDAIGDEVESVVICALRALARAGSQLDFTDKHVSAILFTLKMMSPAIRRQVHRTLSSLILGSRSSHIACCLALFDNIRQFPSDIDSIWACCAHLGRNHSQLTRANLNRLLELHPMFLSQEAKMDDPTYIAKLLIIFSAAGADGTSSQIMRSLPEHVQSHYKYICARFRHLIHLPVPLAPLSEETASVLPVRNVTSSNLRQMLVRHVELLRNFLESAPNLDRSVALAANLFRNSTNSSENVDTAVALAQSSSHFEYPDQYTPHWRFLLALVNCLFDYARIRKMVQQAATSSSDSSVQARSVLINELRPRIIRLLHCFNPVPPSFVACLRFIDVAASSIVGTDPAVLRRIVLLARRAFNATNEVVMPTVLDRVYEGVIMPKLQAFDEALTQILISILSSDSLQNQPNMTELRVEIREPVPLFSEPAAEVHFVSHFGATVNLRFVVSGFQNLNRQNLPRLAVRVQYPNQRSDIIDPLTTEMEIDSENNEDNTTGSIMVNMRIPIAFTASTAPCHARVSILLTSSDDGFIDLTASENGGAGSLQLLIHSKAARGEMQKRLISAQQ